MIEFAFGSLLRHRRGSLLPSLAVPKHILVIELEFIQSRLRLLESASLELRVCRRSLEIPVAVVEELVSSLLRSWREEVLVLVLVSHHRLWSSLAESVLFKLRTARFDVLKIFENFSI